MLKKTDGSKQKTSSTKNAGGAEIITVFDDEDLPGERHRERESVPGLKPSDAGGGRKERVQRDVKECVGQQKIETEIPPPRKRHTKGQTRLSTQNKRRVRRQRLTVPTGSTPKKNQQNPPMRDDAAGTIEKETKKRGERALCAGDSPQKNKLEAIKRLNQVRKSGHRKDIKSLERGTGSKPDTPEDRTGSPKKKGEKQKLGGGAKT